MASPFTQPIPSPVSSYQAVPTAPPQFAELVVEVPQALVQEVPVAYPQLQETVAIQQAPPPIAQMQMQRVEKVVEVEPVMVAQLATPRSTVVVGRPSAVAAQRGTVVGARKQTITSALFDLLDSNGDGGVSRSEFRRGLRGELIQVGQVANLPIRR